MESLQKTFAFARGYKTYIAAAGFLVVAIYQAAHGEGAAASQSVAAALTAMGLRAAIANKQTGG